VEQVPGERRYRLGPAIAALAGGAAPSRTLTSIARPHLEELAEWAGEVAGLSVRDGDLVHYVDQVDSPNPVGVRDWTGTRIPMHAVSSGIVLLAHALPADVQRVLSLPLQRFTPQTVTEPAAVLDRIRQAQLDGFAWTRDEYADGITSVAAAVADRAGEVVAAVHLHGPSYRFPGPAARAMLSERIVSTAARLTERLRDTPPGWG
jgi:DNA-binding IclR family transcriptional regulator